MKGYLLSPDDRGLLGAARDFLSSLCERLLPWRKAKGRIFLVSDLHFNHARIIRYCNRPYRSVTEMNRDLVRRWNSVVGPDDTVYCLGDFCMRGNPRVWIRALNGKKIFIRGNHDHPILRARHHSVLSCRGYTFYLAHDPSDVPASWNGWVIHGHTHNSRMDTYPFINGRSRTINVSCECTGYAPLALDDILALDPDSIEWMETLSASPLPKRP